MTTNLHVRIQRPFTVGQLQSAAQRALEGLAPGAHPDALDVKAQSREFHGRYHDAPSVPATFLDTLHGTEQPPVPSYLLMTPDGDAIAGVSDLDVGFPEDPEGGRRLWVTRNFYREPASHLLGIAVVTAAADLTGSPVVDEYEELTGERLASPQHIIARLRDATARGEFNEAATAILHAAGIH